MRKIIVEGHRGARALYPENTLASFAGGIELGVDAMEFDVWLTSDGVPVIWHDATTYRHIGVDKNVVDMTLAEIKSLDAGSYFSEQYAGERIATLEEVLALVKERDPEMRLGVEIKDMREECVDKTVALLKQYGFFDDCWFYAFNGRIIKYIKTVYGGRTMGYPDFQMKEFEQDTYSYYDELGLSMAIVKSEICNFYLKKGLPVHMYCADTEEDVRLCIEKGASLITANDPRPLLKVLNEN